MLRTALTIFAAMALSSTAWSAAITFSGGSLTVAANSPAGTSITFTGTLTQNDTLSFVSSGLACLQSGGNYCTNPAGVVVTGGTAGSTSSFSGTFGGVTGTWNFGALLISVAGQTKQIFPANAANGLGSASPPTSLTLPTTTLASLGFSAFTASNPTITFFIADTAYGDNSGGFGLSQPSTGAVPEPSTLLLLGSALVAIGCARKRS